MDIRIDDWLAKCLKDDLPHKVRNLKDKLQIEINAMSTSLGGTSFWLTGGGAGIYVSALSSFVFAQGYPGTAVGQAAPVEQPQGPNPPLQPALDAYITTESLGAAVVGIQPAAGDQSVDLYQWQWLWIVRNTGTFEQGAQCVFEAWVMS